ncbi:MAG TPA: DUF2092 domain-containing protein [Phenylobacterium sp.]|uniref:DUF2092 domain-containing protein n=1 Tax=Phenylobacterium sp. TaxID=1871053 RepID=UPI002B485B21|nr:DUF2092 domain-containing protein [Phenylobacterium sp.]HKR87266.1 DUF2092 domain-containing protein [Phenylobacterium sp.]
MRSLGLVVAGLGLALASGAPGLAAPAETAKPVPSAPVTPPAVAPEALQALKRMSAYLATLPAIALTSNTSLDVVTQAGQRVQLDGVVNYKVRRPDAFSIELVSDQRQRSYFYDGKQFTVYAPTLGYYATAAAPPTIRQTLDAIENKFGIELPLEDLFRWNDPTDNPAQNLTSGFHVGTATIDGVETDQYAFRQPKVDWQIWIKKGPQPLPVKVVIVDQVDPANPAYTARLSWNTNPTLTGDEFTFKPGKDAKQIRLSEVAR